MEIPDLFAPVKNLFADDGPEASTPAISPNLPAYKTQLSNQFANPQINSLLSRYDPAVTEAYRKYQADRVLTKGSAPISAPKIARGIAAAGKSEEITPEPEGNIFQNLVSDVSNLATSLPKLPGALISEAQQIYDLPEALAKLPNADNPISQIGNLAALPGLRLIPGSYIAQQFGTNGDGISGLAKHPLYTALDVLPYASKAASLSKTVGAVRDTTQEAARIAAAADLPLPPTNIKPVSAFIRNYRPGGPEINPTGKIIGETPLITAPAVTQNPLGRALSTTKTNLSSTPIGQHLATGFGQNARDTSKLVHRVLGDIEQDSSSLARTPLGTAARDAMKAADDIMSRTTLTPTQRADMGIAMQSNDPALRAALTPEQQSIIQHADTAANAIREQAVADRALGEVVYPHGVETYPTPIADKINLRRSNAINSTDLLREYYAPIPEAAPALQSLDTALQSQDWLGAQLAVTDLQNTGKFSPINYGQIRRDLLAVEVAERRALPARWGPVATQELQSRIIKGLDDKSLTPRTLSPEVAIQAASARLYGDILRPEELTLMTRDIESTWRKVAAESEIQPLYSHKVTPERAAQSIDSPAVFDYAPSVSQFKERLWDDAGSVLDPVIALRHQGLEIVQREVFGKFTDDLVRWQGVSEAALQARYLEAYGELLDKNPLVDAKSALKKYIAKDYVEFDPNAFINPSVTRSGLSSFAPGEKIYLPKSTVSVINDLKSQMRGQLSRAVDPAMKIFRTSVLTLSPRWYLGNVIGGAVFTALQADNPLTIARYAKDAWAMSKDPTLLLDLNLKSSTPLSIARQDIRGLPPQVAALQQAREWMTGLDTKSPATMAQTFQRFEAGKGLKKLYENDFTNRLRQGLTKFQSAGAEFNSRMDNFYNAMNTLEGIDRGLLKGLPETDAIRMGVEHGRRIFETWDTMTPTERMVIKGVFPFYGFTRNLLKFVLQYPATHPTRLSILSSLAKAEEADFGSGLPDQLSRLLYLGPTDVAGRVNAINVGGLNPFQDVGSYATLLGFVAGADGDLSAITKNMNPLITTGLKQLGVDPSRGQGDLYPDLTFDPATGSLSAKTGNPMVDLANSIIPQSSIITNLMGMNARFKATLQSNPEAAGRTLLSAAGVPTLLRTVDLPTERIKSELTRSDQQKLDLTSALKSGDWDLAERWPKLRPLIAKLKATPPDELRAMSLQVDDKGVLGALKAGGIGTR